MTGSFEVEVFGIYDRAIFLSEIMRYLSKITGYRFTIVIIEIKFYSFGTQLSTRGCTCTVNSDFGILVVIKA